MKRTCYWYQDPDSLPQPSRASEPRQSPATTAQAGAIRGSQWLAEIRHEVEHTVSYLEQQKQL